MEEQLHDHTLKLEEYLQIFIPAAPLSRQLIIEPYEDLFDLLHIGIQIPSWYQTATVWEPGRGSALALGLLISLLLHYWPTDQQVSSRARSFCYMSLPHLTSRVAHSPSVKNTVRQRRRLRNTMYQCMCKTFPPSVATLYPLHCGTNFTSSCGPNTCRSMRHLIAVHETTRPLSFKPRSARVPVSCWEYGRVEKVAI